MYYKMVNVCKNISKIGGFVNVGIKRIGKPRGLGRLPAGRGHRGYGSY